MRKLLALFTLLLLLSPTGAAAPVSGDECSSLNYLLAEAIHGMETMNQELAYDALAISWDIEAGRGPGDPVYDYDLAKCISDGQWYDGYQATADSINEQLHEARCM